MHMLLCTTISHHIQLGQEGATGAAKLPMEKRHRKMSAQCLDTLMKLRVCVILQMPHSHSLLIGIFLIRLFTSGLISVLKQMWTRSVTNPAAVLWNLALSCRLTKYHQLGQQRAQLGLARLFEQTSLLSQNVPRKQSVEVGAKYRKGAREMRELHTLRRHSATVADLAQSPKAGWGHGHCPHLGDSLVLYHGHITKRALLAKGKPCVCKTGFLGSTAAFAHIEACIPKAVPSRGSWHGTRYSAAQWNDSKLCLLLTWSGRLQHLCYRNCSPTAMQWNL